MGTMQRRTRVVDAERSRSLERLVRARLRYHGSMAIKSTQFIPSRTKRRSDGQTAMRTQSSMVKMETVAISMALQMSVACELPSSAKDVSITSDVALVTIVHTMKRFHAVFFSVRSHSMARMRPLAYGRHAVLLLIRWKDTADCGRKDRARVALK